MTLRAPGWLVMIILTASVAGCNDASEEPGFAGLDAQQADADEAGFVQPEPGDTLEFPDDWGPHPRHRVEWWYLTANLETADGRPLGVQWTQFRQALQSRALEQTPPDPGNWPMDSAWMAHGAVSFEGDHWFAEKLARGDVGHAGARAEPFQVWLDDWQLASVPDSRDWHLQAQGDGWGYDLRLHKSGDVIAHGDGGFSAKSGSGEGSMYFSLVDIQIAGTVTLGERILRVSGKGWFDREWSSQFLKAGQQGWDWFGLHLDDGRKLMAFRLRAEDSGAYSSGSWINEEGDVATLGDDELTLNPVSWRGTPNGRVPVKWHLTIPEREVDLSVAAPPGEYWNTGFYPYWESPVSVTGSHPGKGYMELTGYGDEAR